MKTVNPLEKHRNSCQTKMKTNRNWNRRYQDGHHKPRGKK